MWQLISKDCAFDGSTTESIVLEIMVFCGLNYTRENSLSQPCFELKTVLLMRHKLKTY